ncbi:exonuclease domain-containing protein [Nocardioides sp. Bht2]|uniref:3'-5' exonuclease n=1 Tax=Nocardioides sp. Bht2 TaxID=3392297 RepID=UPI0039B4BE4C
MRQEKASVRPRLGTEHQRTGLSPTWRRGFGPFTVIDFETTGLSLRHDRVVEVAVDRVDASGQVEDEFATLINPEGRDVGPAFIHGITNDQVRNAPTFADVTPELMSRLSGTVVVAHNATFEEAFLAAELRRAGISTAPTPALCTLWLGRQTFSTPNYKLATIARAASVPLVDKHAALGDVRAVAAGLTPGSSTRGKARPRCGDLGAPVAVRLDGEHVGGS